MFRCGNKPLRHAACSTRGWDASYSREQSGHCRKAYVRAGPAKADSFCSSARFDAPLWRSPEAHTGPPCVQVRLSLCVFLTLEQRYCLCYVASPLHAQME